MLAAIDPRLFPQRWGKFYMALEPEATIPELYWKHFCLMKVPIDKSFKFCQVDHNRLKVHLDVM